MTRFLSILIMWLAASVCWGQDFTDPRCKITADDPGAYESKGSGTLVNRDDQFGYVLTNWHVIKDRIPGTQIRCSFRNGCGYMGCVIGQDETYDLAMVRIYRPTVEAAQVGEFDSGEFFYQGYPLGTLGPVKQGPTVDSQRFSRVHGGFPMAFLGVAAEQGESGAGVFDKETGKLAGIVWGEDGAHTAVTYGEPFQEFMVRYAQCGGSSNGRCYPQYAQPQYQVQPSRPSMPAPSQPPVVAVQPGENPIEPLQEELAAQAALIVKLEARLEVLEGRQGEPGPTGPPGPQGPPGLAGNAPSIDINALAIAVGAQLNYQEIAAGVQPYLKPFYIRTFSDSPFQPVRLGQDVDLHLGRTPQH